MNAHRSFLTRLGGTSRELRLFALASLLMGVGFTVVEATFNNFLSDRFTLSGFQRSFLEFPRELPGFLVIFVSALLCTLCTRRLGAVSMLLASVGTLLLGFLSYTYSIMTLWLFIYSMGIHLTMPLSSTIGMELAKEGKTGQRLGQLNAVRNLASVAGSLLVYVFFKFLGLSFQHTFTVAAVTLGAAGILMFAMKPEVKKAPRVYLRLKKEYRLFYILAVLFGSRKQIFITFAPWVLVTIFHQPTETMATLMIIGGVIGILFQPLLGWAIDRLGERFVLASEGVLLVFVCLGYGFSTFLFSEHTAFLIACGCFLVDQMLMSVGMARSTYMKKIALCPEDIQTALSAAVTIDHVFSISLSLISGILWSAWGFQYVFLLGILIACVNFFTALRVRIPTSS